MKSRPRGGRQPGRHDEAKTAPSTIVGVISDTHGLLRPEAIQALAGAGQILHAGDVGSSAVLAALGALAPVTAVRGNNDRDAWAECLPGTAVLELHGVRILVLHDLDELACDPRREGFRVVVSGHSHRPACEERDGVLWFNPGSAGPRRFRLPVALGRLVVAGGAVRAETVLLGAGG